jgi:hypothetical protein
MDKVYCEDCKYVSKFAMPPELWQCRRDEYRWDVSYNLEAVVRTIPRKKYLGFCKHCNTGECPLFEKSTLVKIREFFRG